VLRFFSEIYILINLPQ